MRIIVILFIMAALLSCNDNIRRDRPTANLGNYIVKGHFQDSTEEGPFIILDPNIQQWPIQSGMFDNGYRTGSWLYAIDSVFMFLNWVPIQDTTLGVKTNLINNVDSLVRSETTSIYKYRIDSLRFSIVFYKSADLHEQLKHRNYIDITKIQLKEDSLDLTDLDSSYNSPANHIYKEYTCHVVGKHMNDHYQIAVFDKPESKSTFTIILRSPTRSPLLNIIFRSIINNTTVDNKRLIFPYKLI